MERLGKKISRTPRKGRLMVEGLEWRCLYSATPLTFALPAPTVTIFQAAAGAQHLAVDRQGAVWYTAGDALDRVSGTGTTQLEVPLAGDGAPRRIVSNVVFTPDNSAWFVVADTGGQRLERLSPQDVFEDMTPPTGESMGNLTVAGNSVWFTQGNQELGQVSAGASETLWDVPGMQAFAGLTAGPDSNVWFAGNSSAGAGVVGRVAPDGSVTRFALADAGGPAGGVGGIVCANDGNLYLAAQSSIWRMNVAGVVTAKYEVNRSVSSLTAAPDGSLWFVDAGRPSLPLSHLTGDGLVTQYGAGVSDAALPASLTVTPDGNVWFIAGSTAASELARLNVSRSVQVSAITSAAGETITGAILLTNNGIGIACVYNAVSGGTTYIITSGGRTITLQPSGPSTGGSTTNENSGNGVEVATQVSSDAEQVHVLTQAAAISSDGQERRPAENKNTPIATGEHSRPAASDPGTFAGEFTFQGASSEPLPARNVRHSYYSSAQPGKRAVVPGGLPANGGAVAGENVVQVTPESSNVVAPQLKSAAILQAASAAADAKPAPASDQANTQNVFQSFVNWWKLTAYLSAAGELQAWCCRQLYW